MSIKSKACGAATLLALIAAGSAVGPLSAAAIVLVTVSTGPRAGLSSIRWAPSRVRTGPRSRGTPSPWSGVRR